MTTRPAIGWGNSLLLGLALYVALIYAGYHLYDYMMAPPDQALVIDALAYRPASHQLANHWEQRSLPDDWKTQPTGDRAAIYRRQLSLEIPPTQLWAIYLPSVNMHATVLLNGTPLGVLEALGEPLPRYFNRPLYHLIPHGLLRHGDNIVEVHLRAGESREGLLGKIYLGPSNSLFESYQRRYFVRVTLVLGITVNLFILGLLLGGLWLYRPTDTVYGWMALLTLSWAIHNLNLLVVNIPLSTTLWNWLMHATLGWFVVGMVIGTHRLIGIQPRTAERHLLLATAAITLLLLLLSLATDWYPWLKIGWNSLFALLGLYPALRLIHAYRRAPNPELPLLVTAGLVTVSLGFHDWMIELGLWERTGGYLIQYASPILLLVFCGIIIGRFVQSMNEKESLNHELERRVAEKHQKLRQNYHQLRRIEKEKTLLQERERIMRDIHDGVGAHLVSALALLDNRQPDTQKVRQTLHDGLNALRLIIDSLDLAKHDLSTVLGAWRSRMQPVLESCNLRLLWQVDDVPAIPDFGAPQVFQVLCILQESITNILKHAKARQVTVRTEYDQRDIIITIGDDGIGFRGPLSSVQPASSRGLGNMQQRARHIGGSIAIETGPHGTAIQLRLPNRGGGTAGEQP